MKKISKKSKRVLGFYIACILLVVGAFARTIFYSCLGVLGAVYLALFFLNMFMRVKKAHEAHPGYPLTSVVFSFFSTINHGLFAILGIDKVVMYPEYPTFACGLIVTVIMFNTGIMVACYLFNIGKRNPFSVLVKSN